MEKETLFNANEAAKLLGVKLSTIRAWTFQKLLPCVRLGRAVRFRPEDIARIREKGLQRNGR